MRLTIKAAMFGLDARIALAIFGALSVISGAALYSAIQQTKVVQWTTYFNELNKASEAYYLDTGREIPLTANSTYNTNGLWLSTRDLVVNDDNISGWQGPYFNVSSYGSLADQDYYIRDIMTNQIDSDASNRIWLRKSSVWTSDIDVSPYSLGDELCSSNSTDCSEWWVIYPVGGATELQKIYQLLDDSIDNSDGRYSGKVRYSNADSGILFFKGRQRVYRA